MRQAQVVQAALCAVALPTWVDHVLGRPPLVIWAEGTESALLAVELGGPASGWAGWEVGLRALCVCVCARACV